MIKIVETSTKTKKNTKNYKIFGIKIFNVDAIEIDETSTTIEVVEVSNKKEFSKSRGGTAKLFNFVKKLVEVSVIDIVKKLISNLLNQF